MGDVDDGDKNMSKKVMFGRINDIKEVVRDRKIGKMSSLRRNNQDYECLGRNNGYIIKEAAPCSNVRMISSCPVWVATLLNELTEESSSPMLVYSVVKYV